LEALEEVAKTEVRRAALTAERLKAEASILLLVVVADENQSQKRKNQKKE